MIFVSYKTAILVKGLGCAWSKLMFKQNYMEMRFIIMGTKKIKKINSLVDRLLMYSAMQ